MANTIFEKQGGTYTQVGDWKKNRKRISAFGE